MVRVEVETTGDFDDFVDEVLMPAVYDAAEEFATQLTTNLQPHRSSTTGTAEQKTAEQRAEDPDLPLADSVIVFTDSDETTAEATVTVTADNAAKLAWLEYGHPQTHWGRDSDELRPPTPVLRRAFENRQEDAFNAFRNTLTRRLAEYNE